MSYSHLHRSSGVSFHLAAACHLELVRWLRKNLELGWEDPSHSLHRASFWLLQREWVSLPPYFSRKSSWHELATWLPALTEAVAAESDPSVLNHLAMWFQSGSLPSRVSPEVAGWRQQLIATWEKKWEKKTPRGTDLENIIANIIPLRALVSLDPRGSRLEEWLAVAEETMGKGVIGQSEMLRLGALAGWRPDTHSPPDSSLLKKWMEFWKDCLQRKVDPDLQVVAFHALLNAMEIRDRKTGRELEVLLTGLAKAVMALPPSRTYGHREQREQLYVRPVPWLWSFPYHCPPRWLRMAPACLEPLSQVISAWLQQTVSTKHEALRRGAWDMLSVWDRLGIITACGIDIAPHILQARHMERKTHSWLALTALTRWVPPPSAAGSLNLWLDGWKAMSVSDNFDESTTGLRGRFHLLLAGQLTRHEEETLIADYLQLVDTSFLPSTIALVKGVKLPVLMERWSDIGKKRVHSMEAAMWDALRYRLLLEQWLCAVQSFGIHADGTTVLRSLRLLRQCCWRDEDAGLWERMQMVANEVAVRFSPRWLRLRNGKVEFSDRSHPSYHWNQKTTMTGTMTETTETALSFASGQGSGQGRI
jgi:hypothetical protein